MHTGLRVSEFRCGLPAAAGSEHVTASAQTATSTRGRGRDVWAAKARSPSLSGSHLSAFQFPWNPWPLTTDIRKLPNGSAWISVSALIQPVCVPGCPAQPCVRARLCAHPDSQQEHPGVTRASPAPPCWGAAPDVWLCFTEFLHLVLPLALGSQSMGICRNGVSPAAAARGVPSVWAGSQAPGREAGRSRGPSAHTLSLQAKVVPTDGSCGTIWVPSVAQPLKRALSGRQLRALWQSTAPSSSAAACVLAVRPQPFR